MPSIYRAVKKSEFAQVLDLWVEVFGVERSFFRSLVDAMPLPPASYTRVAVVDGRIVSTVQVFPRTKHGLDGRIDRIGGIGSVATHPDHRGRGHARRLMEEAIAEMRRREMDYALLFTGINEFYEPLGFRTAPVPVNQADLKPVRRRGRGAVPKPVDADADGLPRHLPRCYERGVGGRPLADVRPMLQWRTAAQYRLAGGPHRLFADRGDRPGEGAYVSVRWNADTLELHEWGAEAEGGTRLEALLWEVAAEAASRGVGQVHFGPAVTPDDAAWFAEICGEIRTVPSPYSMALPLRMGQDYLDRLFAAPEARFLPADGF